MDSAKRVISGTWGEVWLNGNYVAECFKLQAKYNYNKEEVPRCGHMAVDVKVTSVKGTGSMGLRKVNSRFIREHGEEIRRGRDLRFTTISKLADPDAYGSERVVIKNMSFDDLTLADWEVAKAGSLETPFTFTDYELIDSIKEV